MVAAPAGNIDECGYFYDCIYIYSACIYSKYGMLDSNIDWLLLLVLVSWELFCSLFLLKLFNNNISIHNNIIINSIPLSEIFDFVVAAFSQILVSHWFNLIAFCNSCWWIKSIISIHFPLLWQILCDLCVMVCCFAKSI